MVLEETEVVITDEMEEIWKGRGPHVFDGPCVCFSRIDGERVIGKIVPYKALYTQRRRKVGLVSLGVRGLVRRGERFLLGRRANTVALYPGCWEWAPGGVLSTPDFCSHLLDELEEETGMRGHSVTPFALVWNDCAPVIDLCCTLEVEGEPSPSDEYTEFAWVTQAQDPCVPTTRTILEAGPW